MPDYQSTDDTAMTRSDQTEAAGSQEADHSERFVEFYWRPGCPFCMTLKRSLDRAGIDTLAFNIWDDPVAAKTVRAATGGNETVPTVGFGGDFLVNPRPAEVINLIATHDEEWAAELVGAEGGQKRRWFKR